MRIGELLWLLVAFFLVASVCVALTLLIWWLWRKITLPEGAPPPKWTDLRALCLFYLVLLAASEQMVFVQAYILAAGVFTGRRPLEFKLAPTQ